VDVKINVKRKYIVNGNEYHSIEEMPADIRQAYERTVASKGAEFSATSRIIFNDREYSTPDEIPPDVRELYDKALSAVDLNDIQRMAPAPHLEPHSNAPIEPTKSGFSKRLLLLAGAILLLFLLAYLAVR
jgi:hypothetical protein